MDRAERTIDLREHEQHAEDAEEVAARARGRCTFMGLEIEVGSRTVVPRRASEVLATSVIAWLDARHAPNDPWIVDAVCGTGALGCALAIALPHARAWACDTDVEALRITQRNVMALGLTHRVHVSRDTLVGLRDLRLEAQVDAVVCSPPPEARARLHGLDFHERLLDDAAALLRLGGRAYVELGDGQLDPVRTIVRRNPAYEWLEAARDETGRPRVAIVRRTPDRGRAVVPRRDEAPRALIA